jgi:hypothetical protein
MTTDTLTAGKRLSFSLCATLIWFRNVVILDRNGRASPTLCLFVVVVDHEFVLKFKISRSAS